MQNKRSNQFWLLTLTSLGFFMSMMDSMIITTASTSIRTDFKISVSTLQWALNAYNITIAAVLLVGVAFGERFGRRKIYNLGIGIFTLGSLLCALSPNITSLVLARIVAGIGASVMTPMSMAILTNTLPVAKRGKALGIWSGIGGLALIIGPSLGGLIVSTLSWQWIFWINIPIGIIDILLTSHYLPESLGSATPINPLDASLIIISSASIIWALSTSTSSPRPIVSILVGCFGLVLVGYFIQRQRNTKTPLIPLNFFKVPVFRNGNLATFLLYASMYGVVFFLPQFLQSGLGSNSLEAGLQMLPWTGTLVFVAPFAGTAVDRFGEHKIATLGLTLQGIGYLAIAFLLYGHYSYWQFILPLMLAGAGLSMAGPALQKSVLGAVEPSAIGKASGIYNMFRLLGGAVGVTLSVIFFYQSGSIADQHALILGFKAVMFGAAGLSFLGLPFMLRLKK